MPSDLAPLYRDAHTIIRRAIACNMPDAAVRNALKQHTCSGAVYLLAIGKAAWTMAHAARQELGDRIAGGIVITKYGHSRGDIGGMEIIEAGHPLSDRNTILGTEKALAMAESLRANDELLFLISGGGSALFEKPLPGLTLDDIVDINNQLLASGADIVEINMIRKRLSAVKAGRFAAMCAPAKVFTVVLSDVLGDRLDSIASGPAAPDLSTAAEALGVVEKYHLTVNGTVQQYLAAETPKSLDNVTAVITGSVRTLCQSAAAAAQSLGYTPHILCTDMAGEAREAGRFIAALARQLDRNNADSAIHRPCALIFGGETVVHLTGNGTGGRSQEIALSAAEGIAGLDKLVVFSAGSDGTDGPTDAAGGIVDGTTLAKLNTLGLSIPAILANNDAYPALKAAGALILTGPTGTNVNDLAVALAE
ncbi:D-glycerate 2-kinase [Spirochaetia bacterium]|nr:D-glycerate 2-kinase [Spirochaetia bacterium]